MTIALEIQSLTKLPFSVALEVVLQGLRVRLGRSVVTITGVALGVAFLMSLLSRQAISQGLEVEISQRADTQRMLSVLTSETGPLEGKVVGILQVGPINDSENRLLLAIEQQSPARVQSAATEGVALSAPAADSVSAADVGREACVLLVVGGAPPADVGRYLTGATAPRLATVRGFGLPADVAFVNLAQREHADSAATELTRRRERTRTIWVVAIALMVTVIGISNAMLMSVTERFREIGTMKCLGAVSSFIRRLFLIESVLIGSVGSAAGVLMGAMIPILFDCFDYGPRLLLAGMHWETLLVDAAAAMTAGVVLSVIAALYPARFASRMVPAMALRSNI
jgi:ABC-type antimicrobial peptide transport system permease subunit